MNRNSINVGKKIKTYRKAKKYTLKNLAEKTGLSIGFLSQLERGMTTIAIDSLFNLANVLDVDIMDFFDAAPKSCDDPVVHSYSRPVLRPRRYSFIWAERRTTIFRLCQSCCS